MSKRSWSDDDQHEFDELLDAALAEDAVAGRRDVFLAGLDDAVQAQRYWALDTLREIREGGADRILKRERSARLPRVPVSGDDGTVIGSVPREFGVKRRDAAGQEVHQRTLFDLMTWEELRRKQGELRAQADAYELDADAVGRLLSLETQAPGTATPAEACAKLGTTVEAWLAEGAA